MAKKIEFSSILLTALQQVFQCGALNDVSDYVVTTTAQTGKFRTPSETIAAPTPPPSASSSATTTRPNNEQDECSTNQEHVPALQPSHSSTSSIYVVPSREALEEMVMSSRSTRRQGLFDMDRLFSCGSRESVTEDDLDHHDDDVDDDDAADPASTSSLLSRSASKTSSGNESTIQRGDSIQRRRHQQQRRQRPHEEMNSRDVEYRFKVQLSPPRTDVRHQMYTTNVGTSERDQWDYTLRKTMSDSLQQLPSAKGTESGFTVHTLRQPYSQEALEQRPQ